MEDKKMLKEFYLIADELDKNILKFNELEEKLKMAKENNDIELAQSLLIEYKNVSNNIQLLKEKSETFEEGLWPTIEFYDSHMSEKYNQRVL